MTEQFEPAVCRDCGLFDVPDHRCPPPWLRPVSDIVLDLRSRLTRGDRIRIRCAWYGSAVVIGMWWPYVWR